MERTIRLTAAILALIALSACNTIGTRVPPTPTLRAATPTAEGPTLSPPPPSGLSLPANSLS